MTNRNRKNNKHGIKLLDLSFEGHCNASAGPVAMSPSTLPNNLHMKNKYSNGSLSSYGQQYSMGYRGIRKYPPNMYSANRANNQQQHPHGNWISAPSPSWTHSVNQEHDDLGESPLFVHKLLPPTNLNSGSSSYLHGTVDGKRRRPLSASDAPQNYRPNSMHQYLTSTELKDASKQDVNVKLGRPTRTTLLRARQRCCSAPVNAYDKRRALLKKLEQRADKRRCLTSGGSISDILGLHLPEGESMHGFITGARYNRANQLDANSLTEHGVYMPRGNPLGCFVVEKGQDKEAREETGDETEEHAAPATPTIFEESPDDVAHPVPSRMTHPSPACSPLPPPQRPTSPDSHTLLAWADDGVQQVESGGALFQRVQHKDRESPPPGLLLTAERRQEHSSMPHLAVTDSVNQEDLLNVKGVGLNGATTTRTQSARPASAKQISVSHNVSANICSTPVLPSVMVQGTSIGRNTRHQEEPIDQTLLANKPKGSSASILSEKATNSVSPLPQADSKLENGNGEDQSISEIVGVKEGEDGEVEITDENESDAIRMPNARGESVENESDAIHVPNVKVESPESKADNYTEEVTVDREADNDEEIPSDGQDSSDEDDEMFRPVGGIRPMSSNIARPCSSVRMRRPMSAKGRRPRVRFADEIGPSTDHKPSKKDENVQFFLTEDKEDCTPNAEGAPVKKKKVPTATLR